MGQCMPVKDDHLPAPPPSPAPPFRSFSSMDKASLLALRIRDAPHLDLDRNTLAKRRGIHLYPVPHTHYQAVAV